MARIQDAVRDEMPSSLMSLLVAPSACPPVASLALCAAHFQMSYRSSRRRGVTCSAPESTTPKSRIVSARGSCLSVDHRHLRSCAMPRSSLPVLKQDGERLLCVLVELTIGGGRVFERDTMGDQLGHVDILQKV